MALVATVVSGQELKTGNNEAARPLSPAEQREAFTLPEGFTIELVASEETGLPKPVSVAFDDAGRLWSVTATEYPRDQDPGVWTTPGRDRVVVIDSPFGPGPHTPRVFADGMVLPLSVLPYRNGALVAQGPEILFLEDRDGDGRADDRRVLLRGFGVQDTHTLPHQLEHLPGNWIVFSQGVLNNGTAVTTRGKRVNADKTFVARFRADGSDLEILSTGLNNIWSWVQDRNGRVFVHEANDLGYGLVPWERDATYPSFIPRLMHPEAPYHPPTSPELALGGTGFSGLALSEDRGSSFPPPWHEVLFVANPITRSINAVTATRGTNEVYRFRQLPDLVRCRDESFRPVAVRFGPDGCLYIVDWYNRIISHNEVDRNHPARDKTRGRLWRVRHRDMPHRPVPNVAAAPDAALLRHLQADSTWELRAAWHQIVQRNARALVPALTALARDPAGDSGVRIHALWCLEGLGVFDREVLAALITSPEVDIRHEAVRALSTLRPPLPVAVALLAPLAEEPTFRVRNEVLRYLRDCPEALDPDTLAWVRRWRTAPDLGRKVKGWDREYLEPGGVYESAFQNLLVQMVEEKAHPRTGGVESARWTGVVRTVPSPDAAARRQREEHLAVLTRQVEASTAVDLERGRRLFHAACAACHSVERNGSGFAPPLSGSRNRTTEALLGALLDPAQAVEVVFRPFQVETTDGETVEGFLGDVTAEVLTLRFAGGLQRVFPVKEIRSAGYVNGASLMPEGLLDSLSAVEVADLVRYVQSLQ
ncbi:MAG: HEAT repeat domain-containing protein [Verrucomicrobia bacterium]|nr:HEAT repeat domain-containing protein [Verrucomicrobiota bacterium]